MVIYPSDKILKSLVGVSGEFPTNIGENMAQYGVCTGLSFLLDLSASLFPFEARLTNAGHQQKSTFLIPSYSILLHLVPLILGVRRE